MSDKEYLEGILAYNERVIRDFFFEFKSVVLSLVHKKDSYNLVNPDEFYSKVAMDVITKIKTRKLRQDNLHSKLSTYVYSVAQNQLNQVFRDNKKNMLVFGDILPDQAIHEDIPENNTDQDVKNVLSLLKGANELCFKIITDFYLNEMDYDKLAQKYNFKNYNSIKKKKGKCLETARKVSLDYSQKIRYAEQ